MERSPTKEETQQLLLRALQAARKRYEANQCGVEKYLYALRCFNDFTLKSHFGQDFKPARKRFCRFATKPNS
jgi:hypothetical protein